MTTSDHDTDLKGAFWEKRQQGMRPKLLWVDQYRHLATFAYLALQYAVPAKNDEPQHPVYANMQKGISAGSVLTDMFITISRRFVK